MCMSAPVHTPSLAVWLQQEHNCAFIRVGSVMDLIGDCGDASDEQEWDKTGWMMRKWTKPTLSDKVYKVYKVYKVLAC